MASGDSGMVSCDKFRAAAGIQGLDISDKVLGQVIRNLGGRHIQKRGGNIYDFSELLTERG